MDRQLTDEIIAFISAPSPDEADFGRLALRAFEHQYRRLPLVARLADRARRPPDRVRRWQDIPAVPSGAFKQTDLYCGGEVARTFESSGTSGQTKSRSLFSADGLRLMDAAIEENAKRHLFADGLPTRILVLAPSPDLAPTMIMAYGMARLIKRFGLHGSRFLITRDGLDENALTRVLRNAERTGEPVTLIGATFGFVHLADGLAEAGRRFYCPLGSRAMDAGGFKGRSRVVSREALAALMDDRFEIPADHMVNLLGMTELASQFYEPHLAAGGRPSPRKANPHWTRTRVLDPLSLEPVAVGERGILQHLDLANLERPMVVRTDDLGMALESGWEILGRAAGAAAKGCSLTVEELLIDRDQPRPLLRAVPKSP